MRFASGSIAPVTTRSTAVKSEVMNVRICTDSAKIESMRYTIE